MCVCRCVCVCVSVRLLVDVRRCRLLEKGSEGGADGPATQRLLHAEVVDHALLNFLLGGGEEEAAKDGQLQRDGTRDEMSGAPGVYRGVRNPRQKPPLGFH